MTSRTTDRPGSKRQAASKAGIREDGDPSRSSSTSTSKGALLAPRFNASRRKQPRKRRPKVGAQLTLAKTGGWGGKRRGAGRKRSDPGARSSVAHLRRPVHKGRHPVHVTLRARAGLPSFRQQRVHALIAAVIRDQRKRAYKADFRVVHFSVQKNHLHLIIEADSERSKKAIRSGISGLEIAFARRLNMMLRRKGKVWADRYHRHDLKTPKETWFGLSYVFNNFTHHGVTTFGDGALDPYSSGCIFDGWAGDHYVPHESELWRWPVCAATTWLVTAGYRLHGPLIPPPDARSLQSSE